MSMENEVKIEIKADEKVAEGTYSNFSSVSHSAEEFIMDFLFIHPTPPKGFGKLMSRMVLSPIHAKRLFAMLAENLEQFEENFGEIDAENMPVNIENIQ